MTHSDVLRAASQPFKLDIAKLEAKVNSASGEANSEVNNSQMRDIAFCSAGALSNGSRSRLYAWRGRMAKKLDKSISGAFTLSVAKCEVQQRMNIVETFVRISSPVELEDHQHLVNAHLDTITAGDYARLARVIMAKFDKRLAAKLSITLEMGARTVTLKPQPVA